MAAFLYLFAASALLAHTLSIWRDLPGDELSLIHI